MKKLNLPDCPYCGRPIRLLSAWLVENKGEYQCENCKHRSDVKFSRRSYIFSWCCEIAALLFMILFLILENGRYLFGVLFVLLPFLIFYGFVPYQMRLVKEEPRPLLKRSKPIKVNKKKKSDHKALDDTKVIISESDDYRQNVRTRINSIETIPVRGYQEKKEPHQEE